MSLIARKQAQEAVKKFWKELLNDIDSNIKANKLNKSAIQTIKPDIKLLATFIDSNQKHHKEGSPEGLVRVQAISVFKKIFEHGTVVSIPSNALFSVACETDADVVQIMAERGQDTNTPIITLSNTKRSPLNIACSKGRKDIVKVLLQHGANISGSDTFSSGMEWPLLTACLGRHFSLALYLLEKGSKAEDLTEPYQPQPIHYACQEESKEALSLLAELLVRRVKLDVKMRPINLPIILTPIIAAFHAKNSSALKYILIMCGNAIEPTMTWSSKITNAPIRPYCRITIISNMQQHNFPMDVTTNIRAKDVYHYVWGRTQCFYAGLRWLDGIMYPGDQTLQEMRFGAAEILYISTQELPILEISNFYCRPLPNIWWTPQTHQQFPKPVRDSIIVSFWVFKQLYWFIDNQIKYTIAQYIGRAWLNLRGI